MPNAIHVAGRHVPRRRAVERLAKGKGVPELPRQIYHIDFEFYPDAQLMQTVRDTVREMVGKLTRAEAETAVVSTTA